MAESTYDVVIVGAGFGGMHAIKRLREQGLKVRCFEKAAGLGGIWYWNCYPGARTDSDFMCYQFSDPELWRDWSWSERFPGWEELREYYKYVDSKWDVSRSIEFNTTVTGASFQESTHQWAIDLSTGKQVKARWMVTAMGFAAKHYVPEIKGLGSFKGLAMHTSQWLQAGIDLADKRVAVIGTGASGVQVIQEHAPVVKHMSVFQRTPNLALPMQQTKINKHAEELRKQDGTYAKIIGGLRKLSTGYEFTILEKNAADVSPEERRRVMESLWAAGGHRVQLATFQDVYTNQEMNDIAYRFWAEKVRSRIVDPERKELLAPTIPPHPWGVKRPSLEQTYFECFNQANVDLVDLNKTPIVEITENGIRTSAGETKFDIIILATGFDNMTGSFTQLDFRGTDGRLIKDHWKEGVHTYLGMGVRSFPNMMVIYGPQSLAASVNGPTAVELQSEVVSDLIRYAETNSITRVEPSEQAERWWHKEINQAWYSTLYPKAKSWYQGANIPGKKVEALNWSRGLPAYIEIVEKVQADGYNGYELSSLPETKTRTQEIHTTTLDTFVDMDRGVVVV